MDPEKIAARIDQLKAELSRLVDSIAASERALLQARANLNAYEGAIAENEQWLKSMAEAEEASR